MYYETLLRETFHYFQKALLEVTRVLKDVLTIPYYIPSSNRVVERFFFLPSRLLLRELALPPTVPAASTAGDRAERRNRRHQPHNTISLKTALHSKSPNHSTNKVVRTPHKAVGPSTLQSTSFHLVPAVSVQQIYTKK